MRIFLDYWFSNFVLICKPRFLFVVVLFFQVFVSCANEKIVDAADFGFEIGRSGSDNVKSINNAIRSLQDGGTVKITKPGTYTIRGHHPSTTTNDYLRDEGGIELQDDITLSMSSGVILKQEESSAPQYNLIRIYGKSNVTIAGGKILGDRSYHNGEKGEWGYGIAISGGSDIILKDIIIENCWGDGINIQHLSKDNVIHLSERISLLRISSNNNRRQGMSIEGGRNIYVEDCTFSGSNGTPPQCGVDIEPWHPESTVTNVEFSNCIFRDNMHAGLISGGAAEISGITLRNCKFSNNKINQAVGGQCTFYLKNKDILITDCEFDNQDGSLYGLSVFDVVNLKAVKNSFINCTFNLAGIGVSRNISFLNNSVKFSRDYYADLLFMNHDRDYKNFSNIVLENNVFDYSRTQNVNYSFFFYVNTGSVKNNSIIANNAKRKNVSFKGIKRVLKNNKF